MPGSMLAAALATLAVTGHTPPAPPPSPPDPAPRAAAAAQDAPAGTSVDASKGGLTVSSGANSLTIAARVQVRWTLDAREQVDADTTGSGAGRADGALAQFDVPRLRLTLSGGAFRPWMRYSFQFELSRTSGEGGSRIKDAILEVRPAGRPYRLAVGQFKAPFGLQQLTSSGRLQFVDRAITDAKFTPGRDMGAMLAGTLQARRVGYELGLFNGSGESVRQTAASPLWAARLFYHPLGPYALSEGAVDAPDRPVLHLGAALRGGRQIRGRTAAGVVEDADRQTAWSLEFAYKRPRFSATAEYFGMTDEQANPIAGPDIDSRGHHVQAGYFAVPRRVEVGLLWARVDGDTRLDDDGLTEVRGVVGYFWQAHNLKVQADVGQVGYGAGYAALPARARQGLPAPGRRLAAGRALDDTQLRVQLQLAF